METGGSLLYSQQQAICPHSKPDESNPCPYSTSWRSILILSSHLRIDLQTGLFPSGFHTKTIYESLLSPVHAPPISFFSIRFNRIMFGEEKWSLSSSLYIYIYIHSSVTSSLLSPNTFLSTLLSDTLSLCSSHIVRDHVSYTYNVLVK